MLCRTVAVAALIGASALAAFAWTGSARADGDTIRLGLNNSAPTLTLEGGKDADTIDVWRRYGYYSPRYYGGYSSYYPRYYGGYNYGYSSYYPRYSYGYNYGYSSYYPRYSYGYNYGYSSYYPRYSYGYGSYYPRYSYYWGIGDSGCGAPTVTLGNPDARVAPESRSQPAPAAPPAGKDGTYQYDGGPERPVPMPKVEDPATRVPQKTTPMIEGIPVSLSAKTKYVYPAYGETLKR